MTKTIVKRRNEKYQSPRAGLYRTSNIPHGLLELFMSFEVVDQHDVLMHLPSMVDPDFLEVLEIHADQVHALAVSLTGQRTVYFDGQLESFVEPKAGARQATVGPT